jgi:hypothetical protein
MTIETKIDELIAALDRNTAAQGGKTSAGASGSAGTTSTKETTTKPSGKGKAAAYEAQHTKAEAQALANKVKDEKGVEVIRGLIKKLGYDKLADIAKAEDLDKLYDACEAELGEDDAGGSDDDGI